MGSQSQAPTEEDYLFTPRDLPTESFTISDEQQMPSSHDYDDPPSSLYFGETRPSMPMKLRRDKLPD
jgi:hypothetical protein